MPRSQDPNSLAEPGSAIDGLAGRRWARPWMAVFVGTRARQGVLAALDQGIISLTNFMAAIYLARWVSPTEFGVYAVGFLALHLIRAVQEGVVVQPLSAVGGALDREAFRPYATATGVIQIGLALGTAGAAALFGRLLIVTGNDTAGPAVYALWFTFLFWQLQEFVRRAFYARGAVRSAAVNTALASAIRLVVLGWLGSRGSLSGIAGLDAIGWGALGALPLGLWQARGYWTRALADLRSTLRSNWAFGRWVLGGVLANWMALELYPILTAGMISFAAAGAYRALQNPVAPVHVLLRATDTLLTPQAARAYAETGIPGLRRLLRWTYVIVAVPVLPLLLAVSLFPEPLLRLFYGDTYLPYAGGMVWMALFYGLWFAYWPLQSAFKAMRRTRPIFLANLAATGTMATAGILAIQRWGVYGTIAGQGLNALVVAVVLWAAWRRPVQG